LIACSACWISTSGQKGLKSLETGRSAEMNGCAHRACDGTNALSSAAAEGGRLRRIVRYLAVYPKCNISTAQRFQER